MGDQPVPKRTRFEVMRRDNHICRYCGARAPDVELTVDHVIPRALGGTNDPSNLVTACRPCNEGKASTVPDADTVAQVAEDAERWAEAMERAAEIRRAASPKRADDEFVAAFYGRWRESLRYEWDLTNETWELSVLRFRDMGLSLDDQAEIIEITARALANVRKPFRYFCSIAWSEINGRRELAEQLMEGN